MNAQGRDKDEDEAVSARDAALYDPDSVFHDHTGQTTADRAVQALTATDTEAEEAATETAQGASLYARSEKKRPGALTEEMIKRIADRAEQAAAKKKW